MYVQAIILRDPQTMLLSIRRLGPDSNPDLVNTQPGLKQLRHKDLKDSLNEGDKVSDLQRSDSPEDGLRNQMSVVQAGPEDNLSAASLGSRPEVLTMTLLRIITTSPNWKALI